jgi:cytoskeleton protein RodZ
MHLDDWVIDALEAGDYQRIGPAVYAKGHLKKYASLLGVSAEAPAADPLPAAPSPGAAPPVVKPDLAKEGHAAWPRIGTVAAVAILAGGVFWWRESHQGMSASAPPSAPPPQALTSTDTSADNPVPAADEPAGPAEPAALPPAATAAARPAATPPARPSGTPDLTPGVGKARLRLSFSADSWVDIRDYSGKRVYQGNGRANSVKTVAGMAPFRVYLRSAGGVQLQLNDRAVAIGRQFLSGDEARFEAGADGVLRRDPPAAPGSAPPTAAVSPHG